MNKAVLAGKVVEIAFSHEKMCENFWKCKIQVPRESGYVDVLPCVVPDAFMDQVREGEKATLFGEIRTRNYIGQDGKSHLEVSMLVKDVSEYQAPLNRVEIYGVVCKKPIYRDTPLGRRICDFLVASNRNYMKSDYLPCICWGRTAIATSKYEVGENVNLVARLQSREYVKKVEDTELVKLAYELSCSMVKKGESDGRDTN